MLEKIKNCIPDELYLKYKFHKHLGYWPNLKNPKTFNEKLQWLKLHDRKPIYTTMVDKYEAKKYVANIIGEKYIIPTIGVWEHFDDINFDLLPEQFVLKCTHDSGGLVICYDKEKFNKTAAREKIEKCLKRNFYYVGREWPYKNVKPRIIAEKYMVDESGMKKTACAKDALTDFKLMCFNGRPRMTLVCRERFTDGGLKEDFYDEAWNHMNVQRPNHSNSIFPTLRPKQYELMKKLSIKLSESIPFVRIDFYEINEKLYFGEITFYPASGFEGFDPESWDEKFGKWLKLPGRMK